MSRDYRDKRGGHSHQYYIKNNSLSSEHKKRCRRTARHKAKDALRRGEEPQPKYPIESEYFD